MKKPNVPRGVDFKPVSLVDLMEITASIEMEYREKGEPIDVPTYTVEIGDDKQEHEHVHRLDENGEVESSTLETEEDFEAWEAYENANDRLTTEIAFYTTKYLYLEGITIKWSSFKGWEERKRKYKISVPEEEDDKTIYFLTSVAFPTPDLQKQAAQYILYMSAKGSDPERIEAIEALFRSTA